MHGNVNEWCQDLYGRYSPENATDPKGPFESQFGERVLRGGDIHITGFLPCRSAYRASGALPNFMKGIRVVLECTASTK